MNFSLQQLLGEWIAFAQQQGHALPPPAPSQEAQFGRIIEDSRLVQAGDCFVARVRPYSDGHPYIGQAIAKGATVIIAEKSADSLNVSVPDDVVYWHVPDSAEVEGWLAAAMFRFPAQQMTVIGVTGTDGKTSITNILYEILRTAGYKVGMISTIKAVIGNHEEPLGFHVTTPQSPEIQQLLRRMADDDVTHCVLEVTSMGLAEKRADNAFFHTAVISNVTHEHLDYHGDYANYLATKGRLFALAHAHVVINGDDPSYDYLRQVARGAVHVYALDQREKGDVWAEEIVFSADQTRYQLCWATERLPITTPLLGKFNIYNMVAAATVAHCALAIPPELIQRGLERVQLISGRMERISEGQRFLAVVDFAHTPNALHKAIEAARGMTKGRVITVFGSAGRRDVQKRRLMAEVSAESADLTILTAEDPRQEPLSAILGMMAEGCLAKGGIEGGSFWRIADRGEAIFFALQQAQSADVVLICGKGHEQSICFGTTEYPWDDREVTRAALRALRDGSPMPSFGLPTSPT